MTKRIKVVLKTVTPLRIGNAFQRHKQIRPSSLIGSLRFWFEALCYAGNIVGREDFDWEKGQFTREFSGKKFNEKILENGTAMEGVIGILQQEKIPVPAVVFGTTGWEGRIQIKEIKTEAAGGKRFNLSAVNEGVYFPRDYFEGILVVEFAVADFFTDGIFYPLLNFMDRYGFWGGKWNIGYGRLKVLEIEEIGGKRIYLREVNRFKFDFFGGEDKNIEDLIEEVSNFDELTYWQAENCKIKVFPVNKKAELEQLLEDLIQTKKQKRANFLRTANSEDEEKRNREKRHKVFGTVKFPPKDAPHGSKILPWVCKASDGYTGGFISITSLLNLY